MHFSADARVSTIENSRSHQYGRQALKRVAEAVLSAVGLILLAPLMAAIALTIKLDSPGPMFFRHRRIGRAGKPFDMVKFRSMVTGGDDTQYMQYLSQLIEGERGSGREHLPYRKMGTDPRVTRVGGLLRRSYLDELPQLWNVLRGDMSLVGPRPHVQFEVDYYRPHQRLRLSARPGCTGLWQVSGKADCTFDQLIDMDLEYIDRWSLQLDLQILLKTAALMLRGGERMWARTAKRVPARGIRSGESVGE